MYENIKISDACPKNLFNYELYYDIPIITPRNSIAFQVRKDVETYIRSKYAPGIYQNPKIINSIIKDVFSFLDNKITPLIQKLSCFELIKLLLDEYSKSCAVQEYYSRGVSSPSRELWKERNGFRRSVKYLAEKMLEFFEENKQISMDVQLTDFELLIELTETAFDFSFQSATTYGISRERTVYELYKESTNPYQQYYNLNIVDCDYEASENAKLIYRQFVEKNGGLHNNLFKNYDEALKREQNDESCINLQYIFKIFDILQHLDSQTNDIFIKKNELKRFLTENHNIPLNSANLFFDVFSINKEKLKKEPRVIYNTKQKYRLKTRFILEFESNKTSYLLYTLEMLNEAYIMFHKSLCYNNLPNELKSEKLNDISAQITKSYGKKFEIFANSFLITKGFVGNNSKRKLPSGLRIPNDVGEIDFLGYSKDHQRVVCFEFKNIFYSTDPLEFRDDLDTFIRKKDSYLNKFKKKIDFVKAHIEELTNYYRQKDSVELSKSQLIVGMLTYAPNISRFFMTDCKCMSLAEFEVEWEQNPEQFFVDV